MVQVAAAQRMCARAATGWRSASLWLAAAEAGPGHGARDPGAGGTGGGLPDGGSGGTPLLRHPALPFLSAVGAARSPQEAQEELEATAARWATGASASARAVHISGPWHYTMSSGGGGGYYGGGGGGDGGAGGGGSGYAEPAASNVSSQNGVNSGDGSALICWGYSNGECGSR